MMSRFDYEQSRVIKNEGYGFYAVIMAAMRQADTDNLEKLKQAWPQVWEELQERYHSPGGALTRDSLRAYKEEK